MPLRGSSTDRVKNSGKTQKFEPSYTVLIIGTQLGLTDDRR
jgi:hypothetical protein